MGNNQNYRYMTRRIGSTTYKVKVAFNENAEEAMEDKILRLIRNELVEPGTGCGIMNVSQMSRTA